MSGTAVESDPIPEDISGQMLELDEDEDLEVFSKDATFTDGSSFIVSMQTSPGSMVNQYRFDDEDDVAGNKDIFITVDNPESHVTTIETFITYRVLTKTTRSDFDSSEYEVRRRYQDFFWLKSKLEEAHPTLIVHPLPEKFVMKGMVERFTNDFIKTRKKALHRFLNRIADHPILSSSEDFKIFLTAQAWELASHKKQGPGFLSKIGETVRAVAATVRGVKNRPEEFNAIQDYVDNFSLKLNSLDKVTQRIIKEKREYLEDMKDSGPLYTLWSGSEEELVEPLKLMASCLDRCYKETEEQIEHLSNSLLPMLHEYVLCADNLKAVLWRRDNIQAEFEAKNESLATKRTEREADSKVLSLAWDSLVGKDPEEVKQQKQQKLKGEIKEIKEDIEKLEDKLELANNTLKGDWSRWQKNMRSDLRTVFTQTAEKNVEYYEKQSTTTLISTWQPFVSISCQFDHLQPEVVSDPLPKVTLRREESSRLKDEKRELYCGWESSGADTGPNDDHALHGWLKSKQQEKCRYLDERNVVISPHLTLTSWFPGEEENDVAEKPYPRCDTFQNNAPSNESPVALPAKPNDLIRNTSDMVCFPIKSMYTHSMTHKQNTIYSCSPNTSELKQSQPLLRWAPDTREQTSEEAVPWRCKGFAPVNRQAKPAEPLHLYKWPAAQRLEWCNENLARLAHLGVQSSKNALPACRRRSVIQRPFMGHKRVQVHNRHVEKSFCWTSACPKGLLNEDGTRPTTLEDPCNQALYGCLWSAVQAEGEGSSMRLEQQGNGLKVNGNSVSWLSDILYPSGCHGNSTSAAISHDITLLHILQALESKPVHFSQRLLKVLWMKKSMISIPAHISPHSGV
ncbi:sorting nexin-7 isoform X1 [Silurus meridionalis]|nr:sorting nexin-7 isoform X1 [Silurus meridionalis]